MNVFGAEKENGAWIMRILSIGDSWSAGVWDVVDGKHKSVDIGYQKILQKYATVDNFWAFSNKESIINFEKYYKEYDIVLFFVTDPLRDLSSSLKSYAFNMDGIKTVDDLNFAHKILLNSTLQYLKYYKNLYLIGGCQSLLHLQDENILIHSVSSLVTDKQYTQHKLWDSGWGGCMDFDTADKSLVNYIWEIRKQQELMDTKFKKWFYPDGYHPNKYSNNILGNELVKKLKLK